VGTQQRKEVGHGVLGASYRLEMLVVEIVAASDMVVVGDANKRIAGVPIHRE
jgi:hypothetical protein